MERYSYPDEVRTALEGLPQPFAVYQKLDGKLVTILVSDGFCRLLGYTDRAAAMRDMDQDMYRDTHPDDRERIARADALFSRGEGEYNVIYRTKAGVQSDYRVIHAVGKAVFPEPGIRLGYVWYTDEGVYIEGEESAGTTLNREINSMLHENSIVRATRYDALTGLPNLAWFFTTCEKEKARLFGEGKQAVLLYIDLDGMKYYNHRFGFAEGDRLLKALSAVLSKHFGLERCCHIGADRFAVATMEEGLEERLESFFREADRMERPLPVRVGVYSTAIEDVPVSSAYDRAKIACDAIRKAEASTYLFFNRELRDAMKRRRYIQGNIDRAIREKWIQVYYQPIVRAVSGKVCDEEALARWIDPAEGLLSPAEFIPQLEEAGLIYKLDLYVLEQVLEKIRIQREMKMTVVPVSINLSRSDFDSCDIVEEIRRRVDGAGVDRGLITIEITESMIGSDFEFMKMKVGRFRELGFPVWMDDFGSGYSSLDVLQSIRFDLIKFDMSFMQKLEENESARVILTELMKMASSLGVDTVCEGVETGAQASFLREIGCSKLQGFYFCRPISFEDVMERWREGMKIGYEDPASSAYFDTMGRINLYDLDAIVNREENGIMNAFNTLPVGIIEIKGKEARFVRSNPSYRRFMKQYFGIEVSDISRKYVRFGASFMTNVVKKCCIQGSRTFYNEKTKDGSVVHSFARRIGVNPVSGETAVAVLVLSVTEEGREETYADIARALAADYYNIYVVDLDTERFIEYASAAGEDELAIERHGTDFFEAARRDTMTRIYKDDREPFLSWFTRENVIRVLDEQGAFTATYRLIDTGTPMYVHMKITRMQGSNRIILGVSAIDSQMADQQGGKNKRST